MSLSTFSERPGRKPWTIETQGGSKFPKNNRCQERHLHWEPQGRKENKPDGVSLSRTTARETQEVLQLLIPNSVLSWERASVRTPMSFRRVPTSHSQSQSSVKEDPGGEATGEQEW